MDVQPTVGTSVKAATSDAANEHARRPGWLVAGTFVVTFPFVASGVVELVWPSLRAGLTDRTGAIPLEAKVLGFDHSAALLGTFGAIAAVTLLAVLLAHGHVVIIALTAYAGALGAHFVEHLSQLAPIAPSARPLLILGLSTNLLATLALIALFVRHLRDPLAHQPVPARAPTHRRRPAAHDAR